MGGSESKESPKKGAANGKQPPPKGGQKAPPKGATSPKGKQPAGAKGAPPPPAPGKEAAPTPVVAKENENGVAATPHRSSSRPKRETPRRSGSASGDGQPRRSSSKPRSEKSHRGSNDAGGKTTPTRRRQSKERPAPITVPTDDAAALERSMHDNKEEEKPNPYRPRLVAMYEKYNPEKLDEVDKILKMFEGKEMDLFEKLTERYGPEPISESVQAEVDLRSAETNEAVPKREEEQGENPWRERFVRFLEKYEKEKVPIVDDLLDQAKGKEEITLQKMVERYGPEPEVEVEGAEQEAAPPVDPATEEALAAERHHAAEVQQMEETENHERVLLQTIEEEDYESIASIGAELSARVAAIQHTIAFHRRLSGYLGVRAPHKLKVKEEALKRYADEEEDLMAFLINSFGPEPTEEEIREYFVQRLERFYAVHEPDLMDNAREEMSERVGLEEEYMQALIAKHGEDPALSSGSRESPLKSKDKQHSEHQKQHHQYEDPVTEVEEPKEEPTVAEEKEQEKEQEYAPPSQVVVVREGSSRWWEDGPGSMKERVRSVSRSGGAPKPASHSLSPLGRRRVSDMLVYPTKSNTRGSPPQIKEQSPESSTVSAPFYKSSHERVPSDNVYNGEDPERSDYREDGDASGLVDDNIHDPSAYDSDAGDGLSEVEAEELRRIAHEQQKLLAEHVAEAERLRRIINGRRGLSTPAPEPMPAQRPKSAASMSERADPVPSRQSNGDVYEVATERSVAPFVPAESIHSGARSGSDGHVKSRPFDEHSAHEAVDADEFVEDIAPLPEPSVYRTPSTKSVKPVASEKREKSHSVSSSVSKVEKPEKESRRKSEHPYAISEAGSDVKFTPSRKKSSVHASPDPGTPLEHHWKPETNAADEIYPKTHFFSLRRVSKANSAPRARGSRSLPLPPQLDDDSDDGMLENLMFGDAMQPPNHPSVQAQRKQLSADKRQPSSPSLKERLSSRFNLSRNKEPQPADVKTLDQMRSDYENQRSTLSDVDRHVQSYKFVTN